MCCPPRTYIALLNQCTQISVVACSLVRPCSTRFRRVKAKFGRSWPIRADVGRISAKLGPNSADLGPELADSGQGWSNLADVEPDTPGTPLLQTSVLYLFVVAVFGGGGGRTTLAEQGPKRRIWFQSRASIAPEFGVLCGCCRCFCDSK